MNKQQMTGEFFGLHHGKMKGWRANPNPIYDIKRILSDFRVEVIQRINKTFIENISFLEAGGSGNKARGMARAGCKNVHYIDLSNKNTSFIESENENSNNPIKVVKWVNFRRER